MTRIDFYIVDDEDPASRLRLALRLTDKAHRAGHRVFIQAESEGEARELDRQLWCFRAASFLPHALIVDDPGEQVCIGWGQEPRQHDELLINLQPRVPPFVAHFARVAELVNGEAQRRSALRESWRHYREQGYALEQHRLRSV